MRREDLKEGSTAETAPALQLLAVANENVFKKWNYHHNVEPWVTEQFE